MGPNWSGDYMSFLAPSFPLSWPESFLCHTVPPLWSVSPETQSNGADQWTETSETMSSNRLSFLWVICTRYFGHSRKKRSNMLPNLYINLYHGYAHVGKNSMYQGLMLCKVSGITGGLGTQSLRTNGTPVLPLSLWNNLSLLCCGICHVPVFCFKY